MLTRAYSLLEIKAVDDDQRIIEGIATTPTPDRDGDIVEPKGATFALPIPLLWQHRADQPIGHVLEAKITDAGIWIKAQIVSVAEPGALKTRVDEAWQSLKARLVRGLSIGFKPKESARIENSYGYRFTVWEWLELSAVTIAANADATIQTIKSLDAPHLAATGTDGAGASHTPRVRGAVQVIKQMTAQDRQMKTIQEQIKDFENTRAAKVAERDAIQNKAAGEGRTKDTSEREAFDALNDEIKALDAELKDLRALEAEQKAAAVPAAGGNPADAAKARAGHSVIQVRPNVDKGIRFARYAMCVAAGRGSRADALELAKEHYPDDQEIQRLIKSPVGAATTSNAQGPILQYTDFMGDFIEFLRPSTIVGRFGTDGIPALRRAPFNVRVGSQTAGGSASWVGEGLPKPLTKATFGTLTLDWHKLAAISVLTQEEVRFASPSAEQKVRDDLRDSIAAKMDVDFVNPANAGSSASPASITNGVAATAVSGTDADAVRVDFKNLVSAMIGANMTLSGLVLIMSQQIAVNLSLMLNALGNREFPEMTWTGGTLFGVPVITSEHLTSLGSPSTGMIVLVKASDIYLADDGQVDVSASGEASLEMLDSELTQNGTTGTGASLVSLWQNNLLGLKAERYITWKKRRAAAAQYLSPVAYTPST